jgi:PAS domain S-box-containing protein
VTLRTTRRGRRASSVEKSDAAERDRIREASWLRSRTLESSINAVAIAGLDGKLTYANDAFLTLWGYDEAAEVLGKSAAQFWQEEQKAKGVVDALLSKGNWSGDMIARRKDDSSFDAHISACLIKDGAHVPSCMLASFVDVTDCRRAEEALRQSEERFRDLYENAPAAYFSVGADGPIRRCNRRAEDLLGYAPEDLVGRPVFDLYADTPQGKRRARELFEQFRAGEEIRDEELQMQNADGTPIWISLTVNVVRDSAGRVEESRSMVVDISERKRAEEALRQSEAKFRHLFESVQDVYFRTGVDSVLIDVSPSIEKYGFRPDELIGTQIVGAYENPEERRALVNRLLGQGEVGDYEIRLKATDGRVFDVSVNARVARGPDGEPMAFEGTLRDISGRKRAEEALRESESKYREVFQNVRDVFYRTDARGAITEISPSVELYGYTREQLMGQSGLVMYADAKERAAYLKTLADRGEVTDFELRLKTADGEEGYVSVSAHLIRDADGTSIGIEGVARDISGRKRAEEALRSSEKKYRRLVQDSIDGIAVVQSVEAKFVNRSLVKMMGYDSEAEMLGRPFTDFISPEHREPALKAVSAALKGEDAPTRYEHTALRKDGSEFPVEVSAGMISYQGRRAFQVIVRDITARKRMEEMIERRREELERRVERQMGRSDACGLTFRELTVLNLMSEGKSDKEIGIELGISHLTVHRHVVNILSKMRVSCRTEACVQALRSGLLD